MDQTAAFPWSKQSGARQQEKYGCSLTFLQRCSSITNPSTEKWAICQFLHQEKPSSLNEHWYNCFCSLHKSHNLFYSLCAMKYLITGKGYKRLLHYVSVSHFPPILISVLSLFLNVPKFNLAWGVSILAPRQGSPAVMTVVSCTITYSTV